MLYMTNTVWGLHQWQSLVTGPGPVVVCVYLLIFPVIVAVTSPATPRLLPRLMISYYVHQMPYFDICVVTVLVQSRIFF